MLVDERGIPRGGRQETERHLLARCSPGRAAEEGLLELTDAFVRLKRTTDFWISRPSRRAVEAIPYSARAATDLRQSRRRRFSVSDRAGLRISCQFSSWVILPSVGGAAIRIRHSLIPQRASGAISRTFMIRPRVAFDYDGSWTREITDPISGREVSFRTRRPGIPRPADRSKNPANITHSRSRRLHPHSSYTEEDESYPRIWKGSCRSPAAVSASSTRKHVRAGLRRGMLILNEGGLLTQPDLVLVGLFLNDAQRSRTFLRCPKDCSPIALIARRLAEINTQQELSNGSPRALRAPHEPLPSFAIICQRCLADEPRGIRSADGRRPATDWGLGFFPQAWDAKCAGLRGARRPLATIRLQAGDRLFPATIQVEADFALRRSAAANV